MTDMEWFRRKYAQRVLANGANSEPLREVRQWVVDQYVAGVASGRVARIVETDEQVARRVFGVAVDPGRDNARQELLHALTDLYEVHKGGSLLGDVDPMLDRVFPIGSSDGRDKALRYWTRDDFATARKVREINRDDVNRQTDDYLDIDEKWCAEWDANPDVGLFGGLVKRPQPPIGP